MTQNSPLKVKKWREVQNTKVSEAVLLEETPSNLKEVELTGEQLKTPEETFRKLLRCYRKSLTAGRANKDFSIGEGYTSRAPTSKSTSVTTFTFLSAPPDTCLSRTDPAVS